MPGHMNESVVHQGTGEKSVAYLRKTLFADDAGKKMREVLGLRAL
jgi:hypothetical protein